ncbi:GNAT family N-acetyltransferase [Gemmatimonadota bacterium]
MRIRGIQSEDAERIRRIMKVAFEDEYRRMGQKQTRLPTMTDQLLGFYLDRTPECSFVAEKKGGPVGFCLACRWGTTAWLGPIAVLPPAQGTGIGRAMVEASITALRGAGVTTLGLETMPRSYRNLQFYSQLGMRFEQMTLDMSRFYKNGLPDEGARGSDPELVMESVAGIFGADRESALQAITAISGKVSAGLDYRPDVELAERHRLGEAVLVSLDDYPVGFAMIHTEPYAKEEAHGTARVNTLLLVPPSSSQWLPDRLLESMIIGIERQFVSDGYDAMIFRVPVRYHSARDILLRRDFMISHSDVRMSCHDLPESDNNGVIHLSKWE